MCSSINVRDIIEIYFIAPYILTAQKYDSITNIIINTALGCITVCDQRRNIIKPFDGPAHRVCNRIPKHLHKSGFAVNRCTSGGTA